MTQIKINPSHTCAHCEKTFKSFQKAAKFCSIPCKAGYMTLKLPDDKIVGMYILGNTLKEIEKVYGGSQRSITNLLRRNDVKLRRAGKR